MDRAQLTTLILWTILSLAVFVLGIFQFKEKGFLLNNAYLYASAEERKQMDEDNRMPKNKPEIVDVPKANYIAVRGKGRTGKV